MLSKEDFGKNFKWGVTISAFQNEGAAARDGKGASIWDTFTEQGKNVKNGDVPGETSAFYDKYEEDIQLAAFLGFKQFRFSLAWSRIIPDGEGKVNKKGIKFYNKVIDVCLEYGLEPWVTIYHWDLPQALEDQGGWTNRKILNWFENFVTVSINNFGDRVKHWIVMNEPMSFIGLGYYLGYHAPGRKGLITFFRAAHHATLCMALGGRIIRAKYPESKIGVALSCSYVKPVNNWFFHRKAAQRVEGMLNRFFLEPLLGLGYPTNLIPGLGFIKSHFEPGDEENLAFDFDFIGIQYYFRVVARFSLFPPVLFAREVSPTERDTKLNEMGLDVYTGGLYKLLKFYGSYPQINSLQVSESGVCYTDYLRGKKVNDASRRKYHEKMLKQLLKARSEGVPVDGYFVWTLVDNFEWSEGFGPRFGLVYTNYETQKRIIKSSGHWFRKFLKNKDY